MEFFKLADTVVLGCTAYILLRALFLYRFDNVVAQSVSLLDMMIVGMPQILTIRILMYDVMSFVEQYVIVPFVLVWSWSVMITTSSVAPVLHHASVEAPPLLKFVYEPPHVAVVVLASIILFLVTCARRAARTRVRGKLPIVGIVISQLITAVPATSSLAVLFATPHPRTVEYTNAAELPVSNPLSEVDTVSQLIRVCFDAVPIAMVMGYHVVIMYFAIGASPSR